MFCPAHPIWCNQLFLFIFLFSLKFIFSFSYHYAPNPTLRQGYLRFCQCLFEIVSTYCCWGFFPSFYKWTPWFVSGIYMLFCEGKILCHPRGHNDPDFADIDIFFWASILILTLVASTNAVMNYILIVLLLPVTSFFSFIIFFKGYPTRISS